MSNNILKHPSLLNAQDISVICQPLQKINVSHFSHVRIDNKKKFSAIGMNPRFTEHYLKNKFYMTDIHMLDENKFGDFFVWDGIEFTGKSAKLCEEAGHFGIHNPFTIIDKNENSIDYYHFANDSTNKQINQAYLANLDLLYLFIDHFKEKINHSKLLKKAYNFIFDLDPSQTITFEDDSIKYERSQFLQSIEVRNPRLVIGNISLSKRQSEVTRLVVQGKTLKEISQLMKLSERTVGHYFETVKTKLNVSSRSELIAKAIDYKIFKFLKKHGSRDE